MSQGVFLSPIRILDSGKLKDLRIFSSVTDDVSSFIRSVLSDPLKKYYVASRDTDQEGRIVGVLGLDNISSRNNSAEAVMFFADEEENDSFPDDVTTKEREAALDQLLRLAFFTLQIHRIYMIIPVSDTYSERLLLSCHMTQEALLDEAIRIGAGYVDGALFSLLDSEYPNYSFGFVPFKMGVVAISGDNDVVDSTQFLHYKEEVPGVLLRNVAIRCGIADENGILKEAGSPEFADLQEMSFPNEVMRCMKEIGEYFQKRRTAFSIHFQPVRGSDFQKKVWERVRLVPYGATCSYEDIALSLTGGERSTAKNLTRAVGAAC